ncbi:MAG: ADP-L-glycero-D-manno-heptose-6-epimerase [marine bacterium B5-7]|nr:MAG: ADP-L-glycero-D-manno-heptose-6-epimerase [marine bacterium B5-7]
MIVVTGGAGFIGANIVAALNRRGETDILLVDDLVRGEKIRNIADLSIADYLDKDAFRRAVVNDELTMPIRAVFHQGACSDTMESDGRYVMENNYAYSRDLFHFCQRAGTQFIYASSASVYGNHQTFTEAPVNEHPLNAYAYSKFQFDNYVRRHHDESQFQCVGLRYFNVYGYREQHKHRMASVAWHFFNQYQKDGVVKLFQGTDGYDDGQQLRDFVFVEDVVNVNLHFLDHSGSSGIFNVGTGRASSFNDVAVSVINTLEATAGKDELPLDDLVASGRIQYIPMPDALNGKYQSYTQADLTQLRTSGCEVSFVNVVEGVRRYVEWMLGESSGEDSK